MGKVSKSQTKPNQSKRFAIVLSFGVCEFGWFVCLLFFSVVVRCYYYWIEAVLRAHLNAEMSKSLFSDDVNVCRNKSNKPFIVDLKKQFLSADFYRIFAMCTFCESCSLNVTHSASERRADTLQFNSRIGSNCNNCLAASTSTGTEHWN